MMSDAPIYLDCNATTPVDPQVLDAMLPFFRDGFGNAASPHHAFGVEAAEAVETARASLASVVAADPREIIWTSGATESNNLALKGLAAAPIYAERRHAITVTTEHRAVLDPIAALADAGRLDVTYMGVDSDGRIDLDRLEGVMRDDTLVVSIMWANNETGVVHPVKEIGRLCRARGVLFHTDATQAFGKEPIDVDDACVDLLSCSAHKVYGPKGVGALYVRRRRPRVRLAAQIDGGGHERGTRSGTLNVPAIVGMGTAAGLAVGAMKEEAARVGEHRNRLEAALAARGGLVNGCCESRLAGTTNVSFPGTAADSLIRRMPGLAISTASACTSAAVQPSHVLGAMGFDDARIAGSVRFSAGRFTTDEEIDRSIEIVIAAVEEERQDPGGAMPC